MGFLSRLERREKQWHPSSGDPELVKLLGGNTSKTGVSVNEETALKYSAWYSCVRNIAEDCAKLPLHLFERLPDDSRIRATAHPVYPLIHDTANDEMTAFQVRRTLTGHVLTWGNGYAEIEYDGALRPIGLWPLRPDKTWAERDPETRELFYKTYVGGKLVRLPRWRVFHLAGFGFDGLTGYSPVALHREAVGLGLGYQAWMGGLLGGNCRPDVIITHPSKLSDTAVQNLRESWEEKYGGLDKKARVGVLQEGVKVTEVGFPPSDAQYIEGAQLTAVEICGIFRMPPHKIARLERSTFANIETQGIEYLQDCLSPWLTLWESEIGFQLLKKSEHARYYAEHNVDAVVRADMATRYAAFATGRQNGWLSGNDIRRKDNEPRIPAEAGGDEYLINGNMVTLSAASQTQPRAAKISPPKNDTGNPDRDQPGVSDIDSVPRKAVDPSARLLLEREAATVGWREEQDVLTLARKTAKAELRAKIEAFFLEHRAFTVNRLGPALLLTASSVGLTCLNQDALLTEVVKTRMDAALRCLDQPDPYAALQYHYANVRDAWPRDVAEFLIASLTHTTRAAGG